MKCIVVISEVGTKQYKYLGTYRTLFLVNHAYYLRQKALCEELLGPAAHLDVEQGVVRLLDLRVPEPAQAELHHGPGEGGGGESHRERESQ